MVQTVTFTFGRDDNIKMKKGETLNIKNSQGIVISYEIVDILEINKDSFENKAQINSGTSTAHYWFYKLDYLLWKDNSIWKDLLNKFSEVKEFKYSSIKFCNFLLSSADTFKVSSMYKFLASAFIWL